MGCFGFHQVGTFLLLLACICLIVSTITAPAVKTLSILKIEAGFTTTYLGALGYCSKGGSADAVCSSAQIGYNLPVSGINTTTSVHTLTTALILHPIAAGITLIAFLIAAVSDRIGFLFAALIASLAWILTLVVLIIDIVLVKLIRSNINDTTELGLTSMYGAGFWTTMSAFVILFLGTISTCFSCVTYRNKNKHLGNHQLGDYDKTQY